MNAMNYSHIESDDNYLFFIVAETNNTIRVLVPYKTSSDIDYWLYVRERIMQDTILPFIEGEK